MKNIKRTQSGFTLIEILVVIGMIALLATIVIIAINPSRQFAQSRNSQRTSNVNSILNAIGQNIADNKGSLNCSSATITASATVISDTSTVDLMPCLVPTYISSVLVDPSAGTGNSTTTYNSAYYVSKDATGRYVVSAPSAELGQTISVTR